MQILINFLTVIAWGGAILGGLLFALRLWLRLAQDETDRYADALRGITYPLGLPFLVAQISIAWLVAKYTG